MFDSNEVLAMVISTSSVGEYDKRVVLLTSEYGKISAFARGARRSGSPLMAATDLFSFGRFMLGQGKDSYYINSAEITHFFNELRNDYISACYAGYFLEYAGSFSMEGVAAKALLNLLFMALRALSNPQLDKELTKAVLEMKVFAYNGEYPECNSCIYCGCATSNAVFSFDKDGLICRKCADERGLGNDLVYLSPTVVYTLKFILATEPNKLFTFRLKDEAKLELLRFVEDFKSRHISTSFKSLRVLKDLIRQSV